MRNRGMNDAQSAAGKALLTDSSNEALSDYFFECRELEEP